MINSRNLSAKADQAHRMIFVAWLAAGLKQRKPHRTAGRSALGQVLSGQHGAWLPLFFSWLRSVPGSSGTSSPRNWPATRITVDAAG
jgi:hypothetical protein